MDKKSLESDNIELKRALRLTAKKIEHNETILKRFFDVELRLLACNKLSDLLDLLLNHFKETFRLSAVSVFLFDPEQIALDLLDEIPATDRSRIRLEPDQRLLRQLYPDHRLKAGEIDQNIRNIIFPDNPYILSVAMLPLIRQNCLIGSLHFGAQDIHRYTVDYRYDYLAHLSSVISVCIENCVNHENLQRLSIIDMLTGAHNRRAFDIEIVREITRSDRTHEPLSCLFIDLDFFKKVNDTYGHQTGDRVLRTIGQLLKQQLRKTDLVARFGGEEFSILLPGCAKEQAASVAENIRQKIATQIYRSVEGTPFRITTSLGYSTYLPDQTQCAKNQKKQASLLLHSSDEALYEAKRLGRNRLCYKACAKPSPSSSITELITN
ncbi:sensor domain-containing diguanylate cyclase [Neptunomonas antarctica]|nr:sensor domain-containing diguanylate cyclase [Neptunomonas antarctica]